MQSQNKNILTILEKEKVGIQAVRSIKDVLFNIQKLRGNSNLFGLLFSGYEDSNAEIYKNNIIELIESLKGSFSRVHNLLESNEALVGIHRDLKKLEADLSVFHKNVFDLKMKHFDEYSKYAKQSINLMIDIADKSYLLSEEDKNQAILLNIVISIVLNLIENIGKLRAIGVKVVSKKVKNIHDTSELQYHVEVIKHYNEVFDEEFNTYIKLIDENKKDKFIKIKQNLSESINEFVSLTKNELLNQELIFIDPQYYFEQGNNIIEAEEIFYNEAFNILENYTDDSIKSISRCIFKDNIIKYTGLVGVIMFIVYTAQTIF